MPHNDDLRRAQERTLYKQYSTAHSATCDQKGNQKEAWHEADYLFLPEHGSNLHQSTINRRRLSDTTAVHANHNSANSWKACTWLASTLCCLKHH
eukprot:1141334-Pelagomonas_calceolata.AAC.3